MEDARLKRENAEHRILNIIIEVLLLAVLFTI